MEELTNDQRLNFMQFLRDNFMINDKGEEYYTILYEVKHGIRNPNSDQRKDT